MWTQQRKSFYPACGRTTSLVTHCRKDGDGMLVAGAVVLSTWAFLPNTACPPCSGNPAASGGLT